MAVLRERQVWTRKKEKPRRRFELTAREKRNVKRRLRMLRRRYGNWRKVADALGMRHEHVRRLVSKLANPTAAVALRIAAAENIPISVVLYGALGSDPRCPMCGTPRT